MSEKAHRYNTNKLRWDLVDWSSVEEMVKVLEAGAGKYTDISYLCEDKIKNLCLHSVEIIQIEKLGREDFALLVMTENSKFKTPTTEGDRSLTHVSGQWLTLAGKGKQLSEESAPILLNRKKLKSLLNVRDGLVGMDSTMSTTSSLKNLAVQSVDPWSAYILTMTTQQGGLEEYYVVSATRDLDCLTMIFNVLKKRQFISKDVSLSDDKVTISGADNWKKGLNREEVLESLQRHLVSLFNKEEVDQEMDTHHMGHIMCNAMFYLYHHRNRSFCVERNNPFVKNILTTK